MPEERATREREEREREINSRRPRCYEETLVSYRGESESERIVVPGTLRKREEAKSLCQQNARVPVPENSSRDLRSTSSTNAATALKVKKDEKKRTNRIGQSYIRIVKIKRRKNKREQYRVISCR